MLYEVITIIGTVGDQNPGLDRTGPGRATPCETAVETHHAIEVLAGTCHRQHNATTETSYNFV